MAHVCVYVCVCTCVWTHAYDITILYIFFQTNLNMRAFIYFCAVSLALDTHAVDRWQEAVVSRVSQEMKIVLCVTHSVPY